MRIQLVIGLLTFVASLSTSFAAPVDGGVENYAGGDSTSARRGYVLAASGVVMKKVNISPAEINPEHHKAVRWDTSGIDNAYHLDMTMFQDTLVYDLRGGAEGMQYTIPHKGIVTSGFGYRSLFGRKFHKGIDIDLETGDAVYAALPGKVRIARFNRGYGNMVVISHEGGLETLYGHLSQLDVKEGDIVESGKQIGLGGSTGQSTGPHLHFEVRVFGEQVDPSWVIDQQSLMPITNVVKVDKSWFGHLEKADGVDVHVVVAGETIDKICSMYEMDRSVLLELNSLDEATTEVPEGTRLKLE